MTRYASKITNMFCLKSLQIGHGRDALTSARQASPIWQFGWLGQLELAQPFHALFARISKKIYLESLRHTHSPCTGTINVFCKFVRFTMAALCYLFETFNAELPLPKAKPKLNLTKLKPTTNQVQNDNSSDKSGSGNGKTFGPTDYFLVKKQLVKRSTWKNP